MITSIQKALACMNRHWCPCECMDHGRIMVDAYREKEKEVRRLRAALKKKEEKPNPKRLG